MSRDTDGKIFCDKCEGKIGTMAVSASVAPMMVDRDFGSVDAGPSVALDLHEDCFYQMMAQFGPNTEDANPYWNEIQKFRML